LFHGLVDSLGDSWDVADEGDEAALDQLLVAAQEGDVVDAGALVAALDGLDIEDDALPLVDAERTPPMGAPVRPPPNRAPAARTGAVAG